MTSAPASTMIKTLRSIDLDMRKRQLGRPTVECPCQGTKTHGVIFKGMPLLLCVDCKTTMEEYICGLDELLGKRQH